MSHSPRAGNGPVSRYAHQPLAAARIADHLQELIPIACAVLVPPGSRPEHFRPLGWTGTRLLFEALDGLRRRLAAIGLPPPPALAGNGLYSDASRL